MDALLSAIVDRAGDFSFQMLSLHDPVDVPVLQQKFTGLETFANYAIRIRAKSTNHRYRTADKYWGPWSSEVIARTMGRSKYNRIREIREKKMYYERLNTLFNNVDFRFKLKFGNLIT